MTGGVGCSFAYMYYNYLDSYNIIIELANLPPSLRHMYIVSLHVHCIQGHPIQYRLVLFFVQSHLLFKHRGDPCYCCCY